MAGLLQKAAICETVLDGRLSYEDLRSREIFV
jgi:hypothetical protein